MWPWIKRWRDWAMHELWPLYRIGPQPQAMHYSYEKAGLTLDDQPIPWNAEAVLVEAHAALPASASRRKADYFNSACPGKNSFAAEQLRRQENDERYAIVFRLPPPGESVVSGNALPRPRAGTAYAAVPEQDDFLQNLRLQISTLFVRLGTQTVACQTFVSSQCRGLLANAVLPSPTSLVPLLDLDLQVEFRCERGGAAHADAGLVCPAHNSPAVRRS